MTIRVVLDEANLRDMCSGRIVRVTGIARPPDKPGTVDVEFILSDIGWGRILDAIQAAMRDQIR
jgi:hypothetical protein